MHNLNGCRMIACMIGQANMHRLAIKWRVTSTISFLYLNTVVIPQSLRTYTILVQHWVGILPNVFLLDKILLNQDLFRSAGYSAQPVTGKRLLTAFWSCRPRDITACRLKWCIRFALSQWEKALHCNDVSHWLGANLESALCIIYQQWVWHRLWKSFLETGTRLSYVVSTLVADDLATQGARTSAAMVFTHVSRNIPFSAEAGFIFKVFHLINVRKCVRVPPAMPLTQSLVTDRSHPRRPPFITFPRRSLPLLESFLIWAEKDCDRTE